MRQAFGNEKGITLIEIVTVLVIIAALSAVAVPNYSRWVEKYEVNAESQKLYLDLMLGRISAIKNNNNVLVTLDIANNRYRVHDDTNNDGVEDAGETVKVVDLLNSVQFGFFGPSIMDMDGNTVSSSVSLASGGSVLAFDSKGEASASGSVYLIHGSDVGASNERLRGISVVQATGGVDLWNYSASSTPPWS